MKHLEGKTIYLKPWGNFSRYFQNNTTEAVVEKVARKYVHMNVRGFGSTKYKIPTNPHHPNSLTSVSDCNSGFTYFESEQKLRDNEEHIELAYMLSSEFSYIKDWRKVPLETLRKVADLLGVNHG